MTQTPPNWLISQDVDPAALTPVMRQVIEAKRLHPDALVLFRLGDFYELFFEDALQASRLLDLTLTSRNKNDARPIPMCGFPWHALPGHVQRAVEAGKRCAIVEQLEDPAQAKGIVQRGVTHVITPGVILETEALDTRRSHHLVALCAVRRGGLGVAVADASTGELATALIKHPAALGVLLSRVEAREIVHNADAAAWLEPQRVVQGVPTALRAPQSDPRPGQEVEAALGILRAYLSEVRPQAPTWMGEPTRLDEHAHLQLPWQAVVHLELLATARSGRRSGSLLDAIDRTATAGGARWLRTLLLAPLADRHAIALRHGAVQALHGNRRVRVEVRQVLGQLCDVVRVATRAAAGLAQPREIAALREALRNLPLLRALLSEIEQDSLRLVELGSELDGGELLLAHLDAALADSPRATVADGGVIRPGFDAGLDEWVALSEHSQRWLDEFEQSERTRTGFVGLRVTYNRVSGYGIEIARSKHEHVPDGYHRKQTLKNVERYQTPELADFERRMERAESERLTRESALYRQLLAEVSQQGPMLRKMGAALADLDVHAGFAELAAEQGWVCPQLVDGPLVWLQGCRHPVIERLVPPGSFVANDVALLGDGPGLAETLRQLPPLGCDPAQLLLITGPNMAGKSTLMRQVALAVILCQAGSFVPAARAVMGVLDGVLTRIGAGDDISEGASTFLVEMREVAEILARATPRTLVILDEIGRGTSTWDGLAIAWSVIERLHDRVRALCLCATHYHELTTLANKLTGLRNVHVAVREWGDEVVFVHQLQPGPTSRSHGVTVARLAGLPDPVIDRARNLLDQFERTNKRNQAKTLQAASSRQPGLFDDLPPEPAARPDSRVSALIGELAGCDPDALSPRQALDILADLVEKARGLERQ